MSACAACLKRAELLGMLGPRIADLGRPSSDMRGLLALTNEDLIKAVCGEQAERFEARLERFEPEAMRSRAEAASLRAVCRHDKAFPDGLENLHDAPHALFVRGHLEALAELNDLPAVAIVGGRRASTYALEVAHELGRSLGVAGVPVVSGLALGIDAAAHRGALAGAGRPVAVLGSGADVVYPRRHAELYRRIAETGAVISEMPPGTEARKWAFPARNRIMAGLARMTVVVEARERSGSLITAEFADEIGREVGAVPGRINFAQAAGSNSLIAEGAKAVLRPEDILDAILWTGAESPPPVRIRLDETGWSVLGAIEAGESPLRSGLLGVRDVRAALGRLEGLGLVRRDGLGGYERTGLRIQRP